MLGGGFFTLTEAFLDRQLGVVTLQTHVTNSISELFTWWGLEINPKASGTVSPSDSQSNWLNITKTNWTHILFPSQSMGFHLHRNITRPTFWFTSRLSSPNESLQLVSPPRCVSGRRGISFGGNPFLLADLGPNQSDVFSTRCRLHLHQTRESITVAIISNARKRQWPKLSCNTHHLKGWWTWWWWWGGQLGLLSGRMFRENEQKSLMFVTSINQLLFVKH